MANPTLKQRIEALEIEVARLKEKIEGPANFQKPWWRQIAGIFANDPAFEEAMRLGREYRESLRPKPTKRRKRK